MGPGPTIYLAGTFGGTIDVGGGPLASAGGTDALLLGLGADLAHRRSWRFGGGGNDKGSAVVVDGNKVYLAGAFSETMDVAGTLLSSAGLEDVFLVRLSP